MSRLVYDLSMLLGSGLVVAGVAMLGGLPAALVAAGFLVLIVTRLAVGIA